MVVINLSKIKFFSNCLFSCSLWTDDDQKVFIIFANWKGEEEKQKIYDLDVKTLEEAIETYVSMVQTFRRRQKYQE